MKDTFNRIIAGNTIKVLRTFKSESIDCIVTSPPYYGLRDYGNNEQIGLEGSLKEYLDKMLLITGELKRVLKKTGTLWWNHGDSYAGNSSYDPNGRQGFAKSKAGNIDSYLGGRNYRKGGQKVRNPKNNIPEKSITMQAHRLAIRMIDEQGWILRNNIVWHKPNAMPSSVKDRFTVDHEPIFFFSKSKRYYFEQQYEPMSLEFVDRMQRDYKGDGMRGFPGGPQNHMSKFFNKSKDEAEAIASKGRNKRSVWSIPTQPYSEAHFAVFPQSLVEIPIRAGCPQGGGLPGSIYGLGHHRASR